MIKFVKLRRFLDLIIQWVVVVRVGKSPLGVDRVGVGIYFLKFEYLIKNHIK